MKSLADRHEDRARRIAANTSERAGNPTGSIATVEALVMAAMTARARLSPDEQARLDDTLRNSEDQFGGARSLAEAPDGSGQTMAGIGVVNTKVVPAGVLAAEAGNGGGIPSDGWDASGSAGWGQTAPVTVAPIAPDPAPEGNLSGQALADQGAGADTSAAASAADAPAEGEGAPAPAPAPAGDAPAPTPAKRNR